MKLNKKQILKIQKNRDPYLLIDCATKVIPGLSIEGYKILKKNEWFFKVHWPGDPNMPGMLQVEAMVQMSSLIIFSLPKMAGKTLYLADSNNIKFFKKIVPGDKLFMKSKLLRTISKISNTISPMIPFLSGALATHVRTTMMELL